MFGLGERQKSQFSELSRLPQRVPNFSKLASLYNILHILTQVIQTSCLVINFCAQAVFKVPVNNAFPTQKNDNSK